MTSYVLPALAGWVWPGLRAPLGIEDRTGGSIGYALTFDDGPHPQGTPAILEILAREGVTATFFLVGEQVRRNPTLAGEIVEAGHAVGLHCDRHRVLLRLRPSQVRADMDRARDTIEGATGRAVSLYRPPYGMLSASALRRARERDWRIFLWTHTGQDWQARATVESITARLTRGVGAGSVLLLHDADHYGAPGSWGRTAAALPGTIEELARQGLEPVRLAASAEVASGVVGTEKLA